MIILISCLVGIILFSTILIMLLYARADKKERVIKMENKVMEEYCKTLERQFVQIKKIRHDLANHIETAKYLDSPKEYIAEVEKLYNELKLMQNCNNLAIDALVCYYKRQYQESGIELSCHIGCIKKKEEREEDIIIILSSLLDFVAEAIDREKQIVEITADRVKYQLVFKIVFYASDYDAVIKRRIKALIMLYEQNNRANFIRKVEGDRVEITVCFGTRKRKG